MVGVLVGAVDIGVEVEIAEKLIKLSDGIFEEKAEESWIEELARGTKALESSSAKPCS